MNAEQYLKDHEAEAFKKIAEVMGREYQTLWDDGTGCYPEVTFFNPLVNEEQWIECLMYARQFCAGSGNYAEIVLNLETDTREALLIAILDTCDIPEEGK